MVRLQVAIMPSETPIEPGSIVPMLSDEPISLEDPID